MNIYIGGLSPSTTENELRQDFEGYGQVENVKIIKDKYTGESRGFAFVEMPTKAEALSAIEGLNGKELNGNALIVNEARPRPGGHGRGGGGGGGGGARGGHNRY
ncbi:MAG TPA: RNA-binding protein [Spirochaetes bacterium]|nr:RNA-binding protein [Spirochaetota bacterium]